MLHRKESILWQEKGEIEPWMPLVCCQGPARMKQHLTWLVSCSLSVQFKVTVLLLSGEQSSATGMLGEGFRLPSEQRGSS